MTRAGSRIASTSTSGPHAELLIRVRSDATVCLDLVLDDAGVAHRDLELWPDGATLVIDLPDHAEAERIVAVLRQHLGAELQSAVIVSDGRHSCVIHEPSPRGQAEAAGVEAGGRSRALGQAHGLGARVRYPHA
jgi:hypothetical protein